MQTHITDRQGNLPYGLLEAHVWSFRDLASEPQKPISELIRENAGALSKRLGIKAKALERILGYFARRTPSEEREEVTEVLTLTLLEANPSNPAHAFGVCKRRHAYWYRQFKVRQHYSLDYCLDADSEQEQAKGLTEFLAGCVEYERMWDGELDGERLWDKLPDKIKPLVMKRMLGKRLSGAERIALHRWIKKEGSGILAAM